jgi:cytochrome b involved in lipid metabolism
MTRRQLRKLGRTFTLSEVRQHAAKDDAWVAVDGRVYDITEHLVTHPGWHDNAAISTVLSILAHAGTDCSQVGVWRARCRHPAVR